MICLELHLWSDCMVLTNKCVSRVWHKVMLHLHPGLKLISGILHNVTFFHGDCVLCVLWYYKHTSTLHTQSPVPHHSRRCACLITLFHMPQWYPWWWVAVSIWLWITLPVSSPIHQRPRRPTEAVSGSRSLTSTPWTSGWPSAASAAGANHWKKKKLLLLLRTSSTSHPVQQPSFPPLAYDLSYSGTIMLIAKVFPLCTA